MKDYSNHNLLPYNTFGIDVNSKRFIEFESAEEIFEISNIIKNNNFLIIGEGSNILFTQSFNGIILHSAIKGISIVEENNDYVFIKCGSGENWDTVVEYCLQQEWYGMENLSLIPGSVGASAVQNIGAYGIEAKDIIYNIQAFNIQTNSFEEITNNQCNYGYRHSNFKSIWDKKYIITSVTYKLSKTFIPNLHYGNILTELKKQEIAQPNAMQVRKTICKIREEKLPNPKIEGNAGSFFMNPVISKEHFLELQNKYTDIPHYTIDNENEKVPAAWLIDKIGFKGKTHGKAAIHNKQPLVIVNKGGACGKEIVELSNIIIQEIKQQFNITLKREVIIV